MLLILFFAFFTLTTSTTLKAVLSFTERNTCICVNEVGHYCCRRLKRVTYDPNTLYDCAFDNSVAQMDKGGAIWNKSICGSQGGALDIFGDVRM
jgi:hypothetical protein